MKMRLSILFLLLSLGFSAPAQTVDILWNDANAAYIAGDYAEAVRGYEAIREQGLESDNLYLNLGNAYFKQHKIGKSILNYERALRLSPANEDVRYNLTVADAYVQDKIDVVPTFFLNRWVNTLRLTVTGNAWAVLSVVFFALTLAGAVLYLLAGGLLWRKAGFYGAIVSLCLFFFSFHAAAKARNNRLNPDRAVIMSGAAPVKSSPDVGSKDIFVLHEGTRVRVKDALGDYREIVIADGNKGWILATSIEMID